MTYGPRIDGAVCSRCKRPHQTLYEVVGYAGTYLFCPSCFSGSEPEERHACQRCGSEDWEYVDYGGCSGCRPYEERES